MTSNPPILITAAITSEIAPLARSLKLRRLNTPIPTTDNSITPVMYQHPSDTTQPMICVTGIGQSRTRTILRPLIESRHPRAVIITGFAGAANPNFKIADVITPAMVIDQTGGHTLHATLDHRTRGTLATCDQLISTPHDKLQLYRHDAIDAIDMESATIAQLCDEYDIPWLCIRSISDTAEQSLPSWTMNLTHWDGTPNITRASLHALSRPHHIPTLVRLGRASRRSASSLAKAVAKVL